MSSVTSFLICSTDPAPPNVLILFDNNASESPFALFSVPKISPIAYTRSSYFCISIFEIEYKIINKPSNKVIKSAYVMRYLSVSELSSKSSASASKYRSYLFARSAAACSPISLSSVMGSPPLAATVLLPGISPSYVFLSSGIL